MLTNPFWVSTFDSIITPSAGGFGSARRSNISAWVRIDSIKSLKLVPCKADIWTTWTLPPNSSRSNPPLVYNVFLKRS